jgi:1-acyl-sn-glycerol-3-phosphate acyltransferase
MLLGAFLAISVLAAVGICAGSGMFETLGWLWMLPVSFVGVFAGLLVLLFLLMLAMSAAVDMKKPQEKDSRFYRTVVMEMIRLVVPLLRIRIVEKGMEQPIPSGRFLLVCNHLHEIDPAVLLRAFPKSQLAFISKREVSNMFLVGKFLHKMLGQPINRENDREALKTILNCIRLLDEDKASVAVFPEGGIRGGHVLHPLRHGVFKIALRAKVPIVVCTLRGTHTVLGKALKLQPSQVELHLVGVIPAEELEGKTAVQVGERVYEMMARDLGPELVLPRTEE